MTSPSQPLASRLREEALSLGFSLVGITTAEPSAHLDHYRAWFAAGRHGEMDYLERPDAVARRGDLSATLDGVRSVVVVAHDYDQPDPEGVPQDPSRGVIARYARGRDYHKVVKKKLTALGRWIEAAVADGGGVAGSEDPGRGGDPGERPEAGGAPAVWWRAYVDTGPILERELAQRAGLGWFGKNTMLIHPRRGSYFFLGVLLTDLDLPADEPFKADHCGSCTACLDACPTGALLGRDENGAPVLDARLCISYLTIEHRGSIPEELRPLMGNRVFGCDICQEVCPFTRRFSEPSSEPAYTARPELDGPPLVVLAEQLLSVSDEDFRRAFAGTAVRRARREGMLRSVCVALGNWGSEEARSMLSRAREDPSPLVREHAEWALEAVDPESLSPPSSER